MGFFVWVFLLMALGLVFFYSLGNERRLDFERRMSVGVERAHRMIGDTSRRFSEIRLTSIPDTLKRRFSHGDAGTEADRPVTSGFQENETESGGTEKKVTADFRKPEPQQCTATKSDSRLGISKSVATISKTDNGGQQDYAETSPEDQDYGEGTGNKTEDIEDNNKTETHAYYSSVLTPISEDDDVQTVQSEHDRSTHDDSKEVCQDTKDRKVIPTGSVIPMIKLDMCPADESTRHTSRAVSFVSNDEVIAPVSTYSTVSPRRMSLKPGNVPFVQKRGSVLLPAKTVSPATRRHSLLVPQQGYVCPRRTSVLFSSDIFAHSPRRRSSACGRVLHIPEMTEPTQSKRFFLPRKSVIKNVIRSSWSVVKGSSGGNSSNLRTGIRATTSCTGSYYPHRRRSSVGFNNENASPTVTEGVTSKMLRIQDMSGSLARRKSTLKKIITAPFQGETQGEGSKTERSQRRRDSRACLSYFRRQSLFGRRQSTHIPKQRGNYLTGNLTEFKSVFGPNAHEVLTEKFKKHGLLYEITALGKSDDPNSPDYVPTVNLGYEKFKTPTMDRYNRASARSVEKERRETKRKLQLQQENSNLQAAEALVDLSNLPSPSDMVEENDKENSGQRTVFLFDHKDIEQVKKAEGKYPKHMDFKHLRLYRQRNDLPMGMLLSNGEEWRQQRKIMAKILLGAVQMNRYVPVINKVAHSSLEIIAKNLPENGVFLPEEDIGNYVIEAFGRILYGRELQCLETHRMNELHQFVKTAKSNFNDAKKLLILPTCLMLLHPAWRRQNERWNSLLETTVHQVRLSNDPGQKRNSCCVLSQIFAGGEMTEPEILVNLTDLLLASIDTTSNVILWSLYELACHPEIQEKIVEEFQQLGCSSNSVRFQDLREMVYLKAVVKESLRLHPVGFLTCRTISKPLSIRQYNIPQKSTVAAAMFVMGRNSDLTYDPESFIPERWLMNDPQLESFYNTVPFGFGPRACLGRRVAEVEISLFLLHFCLQFRFRMKNTDKMGHSVKLLLVPAKPLELSVESRD